MGKIGILRMLNEDLNARILVTLGSPQVWRAAMRTAEQILSFILCNMVQSSSINPSLDSDSAGTDLAELVRRAGLESLQRSMLRLGTWMFPRRQSEDTLLVTCNLIHRRMTGPLNPRHRGWPMVHVSIKRPVRGPHHSTWKFWANWEIIF